MALGASQIAGIVQGVGGGVQTAYGLWLTQKAKKGLAELQKQKMPTYGVSPELRAAYEAQGRIAEEGYTPEEEAAYRNQLERMNVQKYNQTMMSGAGGSLAGAVGAGIQYGNLGAEQALFANESKIRREAISNQGTIAGQIQSIQNLQTQADLQRRLEMERAYGAAIAQGRQTQAQGFNTQMQSLSTFGGGSSVGDVSGAESNTGAMGGQALGGASGGGFGAASGGLGSVGI